MVSTSIDNPPPSSLDSNETSSGGGFSVARTEGRIGAPAPLRPLPLQFTTPGAFLSLLENYTEDFTVKAVEILSECGVEFDDIDFGACAAPRPDAASMPTILVYASWKPNSLESGAMLQSVAVEIVDLELVDRPKTIGPVLSENPQLELDWPQIQQRVLEIL
ncbi:uncharacterized protein DNG_00150 [Cephalotrichum gorgonifer]|uniref:Uncharacterized protein n=1 Tax=Cephalotrichum gorgonifer TaxID=2041049 RepID=A0AAE8MQA3_9PEZI|nr:uncharacterized protein DNG_00150 [Cephalotrichum gorgonifer]